MKLTFKTLFALILIFALSTPLYAEGKLETMLSNGLKVLIKPMRAAPVVSVSYWVKSGAVYESEAEAGYSELINRILFTSSSSYPENTLKEEIEKAGFKVTKESSNDCQNYSFTGASKNFEKILELSIDGLYHSTFSDDDIKNAAKSIKNEILQLDKQPEILVFNAMIQEAFKVHPCRRPFYGLNANYDDAKPYLLDKYYKKTFTPSNTFLVITGDVDADNALSAVRKYVEHVVRVTYTEPDLPKEPAQSEYRETTKYADLEKVYLSFGWKVPGFYGSDRYALCVLARLLGCNEDGILWNRLVKGRKTGEFIAASYEVSRFGSLLTVGGISSKSKYQYFINDVRRVVNGFIDEPISEAALEEIKKSIINEDIFNCEGVEACAKNYGSFAMLSEADDAEHFVEGILSVNSDDIRRVAAEFLRDEVLTVAILRSSPIDEGSAPVMLTLDNGIRLILKENHASPIISVSSKFLAGGLREEKKYAGISHLAGELLVRSYDADEKSFKSKFDKLGAKLSYKANKDYVSVNMKAVTSSFIPAFDLFIKMLSKPEFPSAYSKARSVLEEVLEGEKADVDLTNEYAVLRTAFNNSPITYSDYGKLDDLAKIKRSDVIDYYKKYFVPPNMVIAIVGDFYPNELRDYILSALGKFTSKDNSKQKEMKSSDTSGMKANSPVFIKSSGDVAQITYISKAVDAKDEKYLALKLACKILEESLKESFLRADSTGLMSSSLKIDCKSFMTEGYFKASLKTNKENVATAAQLLFDEIEAFKVGNIFSEKLNDVKQLLFNQRAIGLTDNLALAELYSNDEVVGLGFDYYSKYESDLEAISLDHVIEVAKEFMLPGDKFVIGVTSANSSELTVEDKKLVFKKVKPEDSEKNSTKKQEVKKSDSKKDSSKKEETKKSNSKKSDSKKDSSKKDTSKKDSVKNDNTKKSDSKSDSAKKDEVKKSDDKKSDSKSDSAKKDEVKKSDDKKSDNKASESKDKTKSDETKKDDSKKENSSKNSGNASSSSKK